MRGGYIGEAAFTFEEVLEKWSLLGKLESVKTMREGTFWKMVYVRIFFFFFFCCAVSIQGSGVGTEGKSYEIYGENSHE